MNRDEIAMQLAQTGLSLADITELRSFYLHEQYKKFIAMSDLELIAQADKYGIVVN